MGGRIHAESPAVKKRGTRIVMRFPVTASAQKSESIFGKHDM